MHATDSNPTASVPLPTQLIKESLESDPTSPSWLRWKWRPRSHFSSDRGWNIFNAMHAGKFATAETTTRGKAYWVVRCNGRLLRAHRIVYFLTHGVDPLDKHIDHIDNNGLNNNPLNLRLATHQENLRNRGAQKNNTTGRKGVGWHKRAGRYLAQIKVDGKPIYLGLFDTIEAASAAYERAASMYFGDFNRQDNRRLWILNTP